MRLVSLLVVAVALPGAAASASPPPAGSTTTAPPAQPPPSAPDEAREHYERGLAKYNLAEFDAAIVEFKESYELSKAPRLLFNIAQAYRLKKDYESALYFYNTYLRADPNPPNLDDVDAKIDEMKRALDDQRKAAAAPKPKPAATTTLPPPPPPVDRRPSKRALKIGGATVAAIGAASCAVGAGMLGLSASDSSTLHRVATSGMPWTPADQAIFNEGDRAQLAGIVLLSAGGALVIAGGVTLITALRR
jgi:tetratricopeptide (TPR) repeat protein